MTYQSHIAWGLCFGVMFYPAKAPTTITDVDAVLNYFIWLIVCGFFSMMPDIDHPKSWLGRKVPVLPTLLYKTTGHRGMTHSLFATLGCAFAVYFGLTVAGQESLAGFLAMATFVGYSSHIVSDFITNRGVSLLWPLPGRLGISLATTGSKGERSLTTLIIFLALVVFVGNYVDYHKNITKLIGMVNV